MKSLSIYQDFVETAIAAYHLPESPNNLYEPISYFLDLGGKRMRPVLALMSAELFGTPFQSAKQAALTVELFHNFTLIHDDIMDEAPLRRGKETVHTKWSENIGILSGDALLIEAYKALANHPAEQLAKLLPVFNQTASEVCEGQQWDMDFETMEMVEIDAYIKMIAYKTAVLLGCSLKMGAIVAGASNSDANDIYEFGVNLGVAFQIQDDILDVYADQNKFGKQVGGDIIANKKTFLLLKAIEAADEAQLKEIKGLVSEKDSALKIKQTKAIYAALDIKAKATDKMNEYHHKAMDNLAHIAVSDEKKLPLRELATFLLGREH
ncbi:MAG: polyprenyl synthetase family protein [Crocinitomix sp.]|nr:polyprenyl synthetase family protein [Crocinitomix sp.]